MMLITPSLLNAWAWYVAYDGDDEVAQRADFLRVLRREPSEPSEARQKGIDLENRIRGCCEGTQGDDTVINEIAGLVKGGFWQQPVKAELDGFLLYGKADVIKRDTIFDIKYSSSYDVGKYQPSAQHRIYLYCARMPRFSYMVSDGRSWWREDYFNHARVEQEIRTLIREFIGYLDNDPEAKELFNAKWEAYAGA